MLFLLCFYYTICQHFSLYHKMEKAVQEICDLKNFLLVLNENQSTALRLQIKLTWFEEIFKEY
ncbi:hypothetical protein A6J84_000725 [Streptococcus sp. FDAARGOS_256]|jgi:hypothetical protein|uniref:Uncharacterized protein n=3 Tax=Bacteria TaxID=2 RepID=A0A1S0ZBA6_SALET|nr:hypothetical protein CO686_01645 [Streptococcus oralis]EFU62421.1 hypothetical protein HMPREF8578_1972 [Streptococcus oralis ATCC 49296]EKA11502.1 hypothetical protein GMD4S_03456 [Streptococcus sp. GMD4S]OFJ68272.1 hypothetical protein HMPREF2853_00180 [Streptococcus sp. HMSC077F03]ORO62403.1 hypothetical protein B7716_03335 [Streptococcus oralis subsp. oralis]PLA08823.1 hypothetical protein CYK17_03720 [Streptococcus oralis subsp. dentisani]PNK70867.1 hypothetical protein A6J84_000725 [S